jgi:glycosyltransferase involved in cell wall biosynthesis
MDKISAVIIAYNEEKKIGRCLDTLKNVADEIIVVDSYSSDRTADICRQFNARVFQHEWESYAGNKNFGDQHTKYDYILSVDADEFLSPELEESILQAKSNLKGVYSFNRLTNYCGKWIRHCGWYPDRKIRLFPKEFAMWAGNYLHEYLKMDTQMNVTFLHGDLLHYSFDSISDHLQRIDKYTDVAAREIIANGEPVIFPMLFKPVWKFFKCYLMERGFQDGMHGLAISVFSAFDLFVRYMKVVHLKRASKAANESQD